MIKDPRRFREQDERVWAEFLRHLTYAESARMTEALLASGLLEQVGLREEDHPVALRTLLHGPTK